MSHPCRFAIAIALAVLGCADERPSARPKQAKRAEPKLPTRVGVEDEDCARCEPDIGGACEALYRVPCPGVAAEGTCGRHVPCAPECCARGPRVISLDDAPWDDAVAKARKATTAPGHVAFVAAGEDGMAIWVVPASGGEPARITEPDIAPKTVMWSPSGRHAAIVIEKQDRVVVLDVAHGELREGRKAFMAAPVAWAGDALLVKPHSSAGEVVDYASGKTVWGDVSDGGFAMQEEIAFSLDGNRWVTWDDYGSAGGGSGDAATKFRFPPTGLERIAWHPSAMFVTYWWGELSGSKPRHRLVFATTDGEQVADTGLAVEAERDALRTVLDYALSPEGLFVAYAIPDGETRVSVRVAGIDAVLDASTIAAAARPPGLGFIPAELGPQLRALLADPLPAPSTTSGRLGAFTSTWKPTAP